jgi:hypothetical protein
MNLANMLHKLYYQEVEDCYRLTFRDSVLKKTGVTKQTFYRWVNGETRPSKLEQAVIIKAYNKTKAPHLPEQTVEQVFSNQ